MLAYPSWDTHDACSIGTPSPDPPAVLLPQQLQGHVPPLQFQVDVVPVRDAFGFAARRQLVESQVECLVVESE